MNIHVVGLAVIYAGAWLLFRPDIQTSELAKANREKRTAATEGHYNSHPSFAPDQSGYHRLGALMETFGIPPFSKHSS